VSDPTGVPDRAARTPLDARQTMGVLAGLLLAGLALRVIIAYLLPGSGFAVDRNAFGFWAGNLAQEGPWGFYDRPFLHDYTPGYMYVLWALGYVGQAVGGLGDLLKVPAILADLVCAYLVFSMVRELGGGDRRALLGAGLVLFFPITWFDSVVWGQVDSVGLVFVLLAVRSLWRDQPEWAAIWATVAAVIKPQLGIVIPIVVAVVVRRALAGQPPDEGELDPIEEPRPSRLGRGPIRILTAGVAAVATAALLAAPFGLSLVGLIGQVVSAGGGYPYLTVNAYNPWALLPNTSGESLATSGVWLCDSPIGGQPCPDPVLVGPIWALVVGTLAILAVIGLVMVVVARHPDRRTILVGLAVLAIAFFVVPTRVHERYLFPFVIVAAILAAISWRWRIAWLVVGIADFLNLYVVLTTIYPDNPSIQDWLGIGPTIRSSLGVTVIAVAHLVVFLWVLAQLRPSARLALSDELAGTWAGAAAEAAAETVVTDVGAPPTAVPPAASPAPLGGRAPPAVETGIVAAIRRRILARPIRPDRSRTLHGEGGGRLDRLDLWMLVVVVLVALTFRLFRLGDPATMHFDEVYHARTATEFLQSWRYGIDHDIYEYTHPHVAKYAIAAGIVLFGDDQVTATSDLGVPVTDATIEPRWDDPGAPGARRGDRVYVATGSSVRAYDLQTRLLVADIPLPGATAVAVDTTGHRLFVGTSTGEVLAIDTAASLDPARTGGAVVTPTPDGFGQAGDPVRRLFVEPDGSAVVAVTTSDAVVVLDGTTGTELGRSRVAGVTQLADGGSGDVLIARPAEVTDPAAEASVLAGITGKAATDYEPLLSGGGEQVLVPIRLDSGLSADISAAIANGTLAGLTIETHPRVALAGPAGVTFVSARNGLVLKTLALDGPATGIAEVSGIDADPTLYVANGSQVTVVDIAGSAKDDPSVDRSFPMPAPVRWIAYDESGQMVDVLGDRPDGSGPTVYVVEPHGNAVYADAALPAEPAAWAMDADKLYPASDRQDLLTFSPTGQAATAEVGDNAFAWRVPGVLAGVLTAAFLYLLARILFRRRSVAVAMAALVVVDPMLFVQSRIAMNDVYAGLFIVAAITLFAALWTGAWRARLAFWVGMPVVGVLLGLGLASKWVGAYAIGAVVVLVLARSALGRLLLVAGLIVGTTILGYIAITTASGPTAGPNLTFLIIMVALTLAAVVVSVLRPVAWSDEEVRFAIGAPMALGVGVFLVGLALGRTDASITIASHSLALPAVAFAFVALGAVVWAGFAIAGRAGVGPLAPAIEPDDPAALLPPPSPAPAGWLRLGSMLGLPAIWLVASLLALPIVVYVITYIPWALIDDHVLFAGWPPGHTGQSLTDLTIAMYQYHDQLRATHAAASPWWAWPLDLKPVWFYAGSFAGSTAAAIYDHGSLVTWWLGIPAMAFAAWQAFVRRSMALGLVVIAFLCLWIPWVRIDRATFQYHWYTSLPFVLLALAYLIAELWHGSSARIWLVARVSAAIAVMGPVILWLGKAPLCVIAGVEQVYPDSPACVGNPGDLIVTTRVAGVAAVTIGAAAILIWQLLHLDRPESDGRVDVGRRMRTLILTAVSAGILLAVVGSLANDDVILSLPSFSSELVAVVVGLPLAAVAWVVLTARDSRRFAIGIVLAAAAWTLILYPNIAAVPLPTVLYNAYQGILPTYLYPFQFAVDTDPPTALPAFLAAEPLILGIGLALTCAIVAWSAWLWRLSIAEREAKSDEPDGVGRATA